MQYLFELWTEILTIELSPENLMVGNPKKIDVDGLKLTSGNERERILKMFHPIIIDLKSHKKARFFVQRHQSGLAFLLNKLHLYLHQTEDRIILGAYQYILSDMLTVWQHLESYFRDYLDERQNLPVIVIETFTQNLAIKLSVLEKWLGGYPNLDEQLAKIVISFFSTYTLSSHHLSVGRKMYVGGLLDELLSLPENGEESIFNKIESSLLSMGFDVKGFSENLVKRLENKLDAIDDVDKKKSFLESAFKKLQNIVHSKGQHSFNKTGPIEDVRSFLFERLAIVEHLNQSAFDPHKNFHIKFNTTMKVLSLIGRACFDTKLIANPNKTEAYEWLSQFISTAGMDVVSYKQLIKRGSKPEEREKELAKEAIMKVFQQINKY